MIRHQRGLLGLIEMIAIGVAALAVIGFLYAAWHGFENWIAAPRVEAQRAADQKINDASEFRAKTAEGSLGSCKDAIAAQSLQITAAQKAAGDAQAITSSMAKTARDALAGKADAQKALQAIAAAIPKAQACEVELTEADAIARKGAKDRRGVTP